MGPTFIGWNSSGKSSRAATPSITMGVPLLFVGFRRPRRLVVRCDALPHSPDVEARSSVGPRFNAYLRFSARRCPACGAEGQKRFRRDSSPSFVVFVLLMFHGPWHSRAWPRGFRSPHGGQHVAEPWPRLQKAPSRPGAAMIQTARTGRPPAQSRLRRLSSNHSF